VDGQKELSKEHGELSKEHGKLSKENDNIHSGITNVKEYQSPINTESFLCDKGGHILCFITICFFMARQPILGQGLYVVQASRSNSGTPHTLVSTGHLVSD
jgi:hypothetical protein